MRCCSDAMDAPWRVGNLKSPISDTKPTYGRVVGVWIVAWCSALPIPYERGEMVHEKNLGSSHRKSDDARVALGL